MSEGMKTFELSSLYMWKEEEYMYKNKWSPEYRCAVDMGMAILGSPMSLWWMWVIKPFLDEAQRSSKVFLQMLTAFAGSVIIAFLPKFYNMETSLLER